MGFLRSGLQHLILVHSFLLHIQPILVQRVDPMSLKLRRLTGQFQQFQALTQARLNTLALDQDRRNSSAELESRVQAFNVRLQQISQDLRDFKQSTREWSRKLERKSKRLEGRLALMERNLRDSRRFANKQKTDPGQDVSNLTLELKNQEERLSVLQTQRDELLVGLRGLQESLKSQALHMTRLEGQLVEVLHVNGELQKYYEPHMRSQTDSGERILDRNTQSRHEVVSYSQVDDNPKTTGEIRNPSLKRKPNQPKFKKSRPRPESHQQKHFPYQNPGVKSKDHLLHSDPYHSQSRVQSKTKTRPYLTQREQLHSHQTLPDFHAHIQDPNQKILQPQFNQHGYPFQFGSQLQPAKERQSRARIRAQHLQSPEVLPQSESESESYQPHLSGLHKEEEQENDTEVESSAIHSLLQIPIRQKIPAQPAPKKDATICNVDSMLFFPTASAENYVTFSPTLPDLHELSVCLWLRVEAQHVGTLLSYATDDNDNQLVLYGRNSSSPFSSSSPYSHLSYSSHPSSPSSSFSPSSYTLDFVIGDPVYRRLPVRSLLDAQWHHLCILWSSIQGRFWYYSDRRITSSGSSFRKGWEIPGSGSMVLGQEQDTVGGGFDPAEGFAGQIAGFRIWNRVLSPVEVEGVAEGRGVPRGVVLSMEDIKELHGEVQQVSCECLEHCL